MFLALVSKSPAPLTVAGGTPNYLAHKLSDQNVLPGGIDSLANLVQVGGKRSVGPQPLARTEVSLPSLFTRWRLKHFFCPFFSL